MYKEEQKNTAGVEQSGSTDVKNIGSKLGTVTAIAVGCCLNAIIIAITAKFVLFII